MQRFIGLVLTLAGGAATLWGGFHCLTGNATRTVAITDSLSVSALVVALAGAAVLTVGLIWVRE